MPRALASVLQAVRMEFAERVTAQAVRDAGEERRWALRLGRAAAHPVYGLPTRAVVVDS